MFDPWTKVVCPFYRPEGHLCSLIETTCLQSYFLINPLLILTTENLKFCCRISGIALNLEVGLKIHTMEKKLEIFNGVEETQVIDILLALGLLSEINIENVIPLFHKGLGSNVKST
ncbi:MAG: hypothetical protein ACFFDT_12355 [Candidatus Hodarchaeota archaeon]